MASASSMPLADQRQDLKSLLECSICLETFDEPRTLPCLHSFCKKCLENFVDGKREDELNCPVCRCKFTLNEGVAGMTRNHFICSMVEVLSIQHQDKCIPCSHCQQPCAGRCVTCELFMCEKCLKFHSDYPGFKGHIVLTMEELSKPENQSKIKNISKCTQHPNKKLKYYCETCNQLICRHCMDFDHDKQHKLLPLEQAAQSKRKDLKKNCEILERTVAENKEETHVLKNVCQSLNSNFVVAQRLLNERKQELLTKLQDKIGRKTNMMIEDTRQVFDRKTKNVEKEIEQRESFVNRVQASADMARSLLENGNDEEIIRSFQSVQENAVNHAFVVINLNLHNDAVLSLSYNEIDAMLLEEIEDVVTGKGASRMPGGDAVSNKEQWYFSKEGMQRLELFKLYFQQAGHEVKMYKDIVTQDMHFGLNGGYCLDFPANFPMGMSTFRTPHGKAYVIKHASNAVKDVCKLVVDSIQNLSIRGPQPQGRGRGNRYCY